MDGNTQTAQLAAHEMTESDRGELRRDIIIEGIYETIIEGGYHSQALSDAEADYLARLIAKDGLRALAAYAEPDSYDGYVTVTFTPEVWDNDYAVSSDDTITYRVPLDDATDDNGKLLPDRSGESDSLKDHPLAPLSVQHYSGPFSIELST